MSTQTVWIFHGAGAQFSSGAFWTKEDAEVWIEKHALTGVLTRYPVNHGVYDWAVEHGWFPPGKHVDSRFVGSFTSARQDHYHFLDGVREDEAQNS